MKKIILIMGLVLVPAILFAQNRFNRAEELRRLARPDLLPEYSAGIVEQISSYDPTGGNEDGFAGKYSYPLSHSFPPTPFFSTGEGRGK